MPLTSAIATALITALLSGSVAAMVSSYLTEGKERWALRREKIEVIYLSINTYGNSLFGAYVHYYSIIKGQTGFNEMYDSLADNAKDGDDFRKLRMNILLYEPTLLDGWDKLVASRDAVNKIAIEIKRSFKRGDELIEYFPAFQAAMVSLTKSISALEDVAAIRGRQIAEEKGQAEKLLNALRSAILSVTTRTRTFLLASLSFLHDQSLRLRNRLRP